MRRNKWEVISALLLITVLICSINITPIRADSIIGTSGSILANGQTGKNGGLVAEVPCYFVSINNEILKNGSKIDPTGQFNTALVEQQYNNHWPVVKDNSICFIPPAIMPANGDLAYSGVNCYYDPYSLSLVYHYGSQVPGALAPLSTDTTDKLPMSISTYTINGKSYWDSSIDELTSVSNGTPVWEQYANQLSYVQCLQVWNTVFKNTVSNDGSTIDDNVKMLLQGAHSAKVDETAQSDKTYSTDIIATRKEYASLLATLYKIAPSSVQQSWAGQIQEFLSNSNEFAPVTIGIQIGGGFRVPDQFSASTIEYLPAVDYVEFMSSIMPSQDLHSSGFELGQGDTYNSLGIMLDAIDRSITLQNQSNMQVNRYTDLPYNSNGFLYAYPGVISQNRMVTDGSSGTWHSSSVNGMFQSLYFADEPSMYGMVIIGGDCLGNLPNNGQFDLDAKPDSPTQVTGSVIGQSVPVTISLKNTDTTLADLESSIQNADSSSLKLSVRLTRDVANSKITGNSGNESASLPLDGTAESVTPDELYSLLEGTTTLQYSDDTTQFSIAPGSSQKFTYTGAVTITIGATDVVLTGNPPSDSVDFFAMPSNVANEFSYTSQPQSYSEIKDGWPNGGEKYEAMAGQPTTRTIYFASGGSEFLVAIKGELIPTATTTRHYQDTFSQVNSAWYLPRLQTGFSPNSIPPKPRTVTDIEGHSFTETIQTQTEQVVVGNTGPPSNSPIYQTWYNFISLGDQMTMSGSYSWDQTINYNYAQIDSCQVYQINSSSVNGMANITGTNKFSASIVKGTPNIFYHIAPTNDSAGGRLVYSAYPAQKDSVAWTVPSNNIEYANEWQGYNKAVDDGHRNETTNVTSVSDFLILQTTSGQQSVLYYQATSPTVKLTEDLNVPLATKADVWGNNSNSAGTWSPTRINLGSYNGNFSNPTQKYIGTGNHAVVPTIFDDPTNPFGIIRPTPPTDSLMLYQAGIPIIQTDPNGKYITGTAVAHYNNVMNVGDNVSQYDPSSGADITSVYSPQHIKVNDIVLHDPVSSQYSMVIPIDSSRDQRTSASKKAGGNQLIPATTTVMELDPNYRSSILWNGDAELVSNAGYASGWIASKNLTDPNATFALRSNDPDTIAGKNSFEIDTTTSPDNSTTNYTAYYYQDINVTPGVNYSLTGLLNAVRCEGSLDIEQFDANGNMTNLATTGIVSNSSSPTTVSKSFKVPDGVNKIRIEILKGKSVSGQAGQKDCLFADSLSLTNADTAGFFAISNPIYDYMNVNGSTILQATTFTIPTQAPASAYKSVIVTDTSPTQITTSGGQTYTPGNFINLDFPFSIYFPNVGNFHGNDAWGIGECSSIEGMGFTDNMDTTEWTARKSVTFPFNVVYIPSSGSSQTYLAGQEIMLPVNESTFNFYCPLANYEAMSADVQFKAYAINDAFGIDNNLSNNKLRYNNLAADHSAIKHSPIDVVGRIGNLAIEDTGDFRFSNLFKMPVNPLTWLIPNVVQNVDPTQQNKMIGSQYDIRGSAVNSSTNYLNTYGLLSTFNQQPIDFPLQSSENNIPALQDQELRPGYNIYSDIQTIGNYYSDLQVIPYYYSLNLTDSTIQPVDVYITQEGGQYAPVNKNGLAVSGWDGTGIYEFLMSMSWPDESARRNNSTGEQAATSTVDTIYNMTSPYDKYTFGDSQIDYLTDRNRTFIGSSYTYGQSEDPSKILPESLFQEQAQRYHFTTGLPSSAVFVPKGSDVTTANIKPVSDSNHVIIEALDLKSFGSVYALEFHHANANQPVVLNGKSYPTTSIPQNVFAVISSDKTSSDDLSLENSH